MRNTRKVFLMVLNPGRSNPCPASDKVRRGREKSEHRRSLKIKVALFAVCGKPGELAVFLALQLFWFALGICHYTHLVG